MPKSIRQRKNHVHLCFCFQGADTWPCNLCITVIAIYALMYSPVHNVLDACISITRASGRGLGPGNQEFFGPCEIASSG
jgi:hypothetical protein